MTIKVSESFFSGSGQVWGKTGLSAVLRGLAMDNARNRLAGATITALTDSSTGTAGAGTVNVQSETVSVFNAVSGGGVGFAAFNTSVGKIKNAEAVFLADINALGNQLGLDPLTSPEGTVGTAHTIPALDKAATTASGTAAVSKASYAATTKALKDNQRKIARHLQAVLTASGQPAFANGFKGSVPSNSMIEATPAVVADTDGSHSVALADGTAFLLGIANNYATLAAKFNAAFTPSTGTIHAASGLSVVAV